MPTNAAFPLASRVQIPERFTRKSDLRGFLALSRDYALIAGIAWLSLRLDHWAVYLIAIWVIGLVQFGLGETLTHEASHHNLFNTKKLNRLAEVFCCLPFLFTLSDYRREHGEHHRLLNTDRERLHEDYRGHGLFDENRNLVWLWFFKPVLGYGGYAYLRSLLELGSWRSLARVLAFWVPVAGLAAWGGWLHLLLLYWVVPLFWSYSSFFYWSEIEDHFNTIGGTRTNVSWTNWITHNNGYHDVHHRHPRIPWYRLREAHHALCADSPDISKGFLDTFRQISRPEKETSALRIAAAPASPVHPLS